jgi:glycosyltransferase involved in cell wall biosynthesis
VNGVLDAGADVLVVDDGSSDDTCDIVEGLALGRDGVHLMQRGRKLGLGSAYRDGFRWGLRRGYAALGEMDADLSHDPSDIPHLMAGIRMADLAIGSRYVPGGAVVDWPLSRKVLSRGGNLYVRALTGLRVHDATAGFRLYRRQVLQTIDLERVRSEGYAFQIEMALLTRRAGFEILEVPITFTERQEGASKMSRAIVAEALWRVPGWALRGRMTPRGRVTPAGREG